MRLLILGDTHGNTGEVLRTIQYAKRFDCEAIVQVGDFGYWEHEQNGVKFLRKVNQGLVEASLDLYWVAGNHENHVKLRDYAAQTNLGFRPIRSNILHIPHGLAWTWDGLRMMGVGGAVSIDREWRVPGRSWWPEEQLTGDDLAKVRQQGQVDVLFTHDCPTSVPLRGLKVDPESHMHRQRMNEVADATQPVLWFHGHMHHPMHYWHRTRNDFGLDIEVIGLDCDGSNHNWCILDVSSRTVEFPTDPEHTFFHTRPLESWYSKPGGWPSLEA